MILEFGFNIVLFLFFIYCYYFIGVNAPEDIPKEVDGVEWTRMLLALLLIFLAINIYKIIKNRHNSKKEIITFDLKAVVKNKLFLGGFVLLAYSLTLEYVGFLFGSYMMFLVYSILLGERRALRLIIIPALCVIVMYIIFSFGLSIMLPRGMGIFRTFALFIESI